MLTFIDESGYPRPTDSTLNPVLLGICIHENDIKPITITKNRTNNKTYVEGMIDIITSYDTAIFAIIMDRPDESIVVPEHHLPKQYYLLLKKVGFTVTIITTEKQ